MRVSPAHRLLLLWMALTVYGSFFPFDFRMRSLPDHPVALVLASWPRDLDRFVVRDVFVNATLYVPLGVFWWLARRRTDWTRLAAPVLGGLLLSCFVELLQYFTQTRTASLVDVACNTFGAALGVAIATAASGPLRQLESRAAASEIFRPSANLLLLTCWLGYQIAPLFPALSRTKVAAKIAFLESSASMSVTDVAIAASEWLTVAWLLRDMGAPPRRWLAALLLLLPLRLLLAGRMLTLAEVAGATLAVVTWSVVLGSRPSRTAIVTGALVGGMLLGGLWPFHFTSPPTVFWWVPFSGSLMSDWEFGLPELLRKTFVYGASIWMLRECGMRLGIGAVVVAATLGAIEAAQRFLPGRTAEITDPILALGVAYALWLVAAHPRTDGRLDRNMTLREDQAGDNSGSVEPRASSKLV